MLLAARATRYAAHSGSYTNMCEDKVKDVCPVAQIVWIQLFFFLFFGLSWLLISYSFSVAS